MEEAEQLTLITVVLDQTRAPLGTPRVRVAQRRKQIRFLPAHVREQSREQRVSFDAQIAQPLERAIVRRARDRFNPLEIGTQALMVCENPLTNLARPHRMTPPML